MSATPDKSTARKRKRTEKPRVLYVVESVTPEGIRIPVDGEPQRDVVFVAYSAAVEAAKWFRQQDKDEGIDTEIRVTKYVAQERRR